MSERRILVGTRKGLFTLARGAQGWAIQAAEHLGDPVPIVLHDERDETTYASLDHGHFGGKLHRREKGASEWQEIGVPVYPEQPEGEQDINASGQKISWNLKLLWSLVGGHADQPGRLWAGTLPGGFFRSDDRGDSWQMVDALWNHPDRNEWFGGGADLPGIHSICVHPDDKDHLTLGVSCGGVWVSEDGGHSWNCRADGMRAEYVPPEREFDPRIQDPHCVVQCRTAPDSLWAQHHNGIFRSVDGSASWQEIETAQPSHFGFPVAVHPGDPDTAWFVPAIQDQKRIPMDGRVVVSRTRDGGRSFEVLTKGLPQEHAYDLVFRHALDVDAAGECLVFGSTTGSLWVSEDGGDSWQTVSTHLPPVYCVRFAG
jgi:hypothetical protein